MLCAWNITLTRRFLRNEFIDILVFKTKLHWWPLWPNCLTIVLLLVSYMGRSVKCIWKVTVAVMCHAVMFMYRWERRTDPRGRTYYVDHNTRTTTWQRPNVDMMNNIQQFQQMRQNRTIDNVARRSLYPTQAVASDDPLGPLPEGWGEWARCVHIYFMQPDNFLLFTLLPWSDVYVIVAK